MYRSSAKAIIPDSRIPVVWIQRMIRGFNSFFLSQSFVPTRYRCRIRNVFPEPSSTLVNIGSFQNETRFINPSWLPFLTFVEVSRMASSAIISTETVRNQDTATRFLSPLSRPFQSGERLEFLEVGNRSLVSLLCLSLVGEALSTTLLGHPGRDKGSVCFRVGVYSLTASIPTRSGGHFDPDRAVQLSPIFCPIAQVERYRVQQSC
ncbi:hypothetical protein BDV19DRAFT_9023 [Aspergillus venezuelensis]